MQGDTALVYEVKAFMKSHKVSQVRVGQEARMSQAVVSQWLSLKYHGNVDKVPRPTRLADPPHRAVLSALKCGPD